MTPTSSPIEAMELHQNVHTTFTSSASGGGDASGEALSQDAAAQIALPLEFEHFQAVPPPQGRCCSKLCLSILLGREGDKRNEWALDIARGLLALRPLLAGTGASRKLVRKKAGANEAVASADPLSGADILQLLGEGARGTKQDAERVRHAVVVHAVHRLREPTFLPDGEGNVCIEACTYLLDCERSYLYHKAIPGGGLPIPFSSSLPAPSPHSPTPPVSPVRVETCVRVGWGDSD